VDVRFGAVGGAAASEERLIGEYLLFGFNFAAGERGEALRDSGVFHVDHEDELRGAACLVGFADDVAFHVDDCGHPPEFRFADLPHFVPVS
jgi:hypothetical protein